MGANSPVKRGIIREGDADGNRYRVEFADEDGVVSFWLDGPSAGTSGKRERPAAFKVGSQVWCMVDWDGEDGCVVQGAYSKEDRPPNTVAENDHTAYEDGALAEHDPVTHVNRLQLIGDDAKRYIEVKGSSGLPTRMLITPGGIIVNKPIIVATINDIPVRGKRA
jgi:phage baseplate assembly protein gpV